MQRQSRAEPARKGNLTPEQNSPANRKMLRVRSPVKSKNKKSLSFHDSVLSKANINDLDTSNGSSLKIIIAYPNGNVVVKSNLDRGSETIIRNICLSQWRIAVNACFQHEYLAPELRSAFTRKVGKECEQYS